MPRYYFDLRNEEGWLSDPEGSEHRDLGAARHEAIDTLVQMAREIFPDRDRQGLEIAVRGEDGKVLLLASLRLNVSQF